MTNDAVPGSPTVLTLPLPTDLPATTARVGEQLAFLHEGLPPGLYATALQDGTAAAAARTELLAWCGTRLDRGVPVEGSRPAGGDIHDRFFSVRRAGGGGAGLLAAALVVSDLLVRDDLARNGSTLDEDPDDLLLGVGTFLTGVPSPAAKHTRWQPADPAAAARERWLVGHQRFFVMLQLLIVALCDLDHGGTEHEEEEVVRAFGRICRSTAVSMRYAADFPPDLYGPVRDTMTPPTVNAGFSGLQTRDHHALVARMRQSRNSGVFDRLAPASVTAVHASVQHLYDAHVWVCDRFGGSTEQSLLMAQTAQQPGPRRPETGVEAAERLARQRLGHLSPRASG
ncbi:hypothetical protein ACFYXJ_04715 [Streptomyces sp. NPDC002667]|uniref:hypothetical protein n=1 Tax=Streptomyces sp. NPDC002667 TaxID=3364657 RepID=UPI003680FE37